MEWDSENNQPSCQSADWIRNQEGNALESVFTQKIEKIAKLLPEIEPYETEPDWKEIKNRLESNLEGISDKIEYDKNRLEQELILHQKTGQWTKKKFAWKIISITSSALCKPKNLPVKNLVLLRRK